LNHHAAPEFWDEYNALPPDVRSIADKNFQLLKADPRHPSLHFKRVGPYFSARVGRSHRVLGLPVEDGTVWFWIGPHDEYERITG
jgi:hypothetical protein